MNPRLREYRLQTPLAKGASSRNLGPALSPNSVYMYVDANKPYVGV